MAGTNWVGHHTLRYPPTWSYHRDVLWRIYGEEREVKAMAKQLVKSKMKCNKPKRTSGHATKSHVVKACANGNEKIIRFGQQGVSGAGKNPKSAKDKARKKSFKARHAKNIKKGKMSAAYWADKVKW